MATTVAIARAGQVLGPPAVALTEGFQRGALVAAGFNVVAALTAAALLRRAEGAAAAAMVTAEPGPEAVPEPAALR